jgi:hypothetical protein
MGASHDVIARSRLCFDCIGIGILLCTRSNLGVSHNLLVLPVTWCSAKSHPHVMSFQKLFYLTDMIDLLLPVFDVQGQEWHTVVVGNQLQGHLSL